MPIRLPRPPGPFALGTVGFDWTDTARPETLLLSSGGRRIIVELHYPATPGQGRPAPYLPERIALVAWLRQHGWSDDEAKRLTDLYGPAPTHSIPGAPIAVAEQKWPVLLFSPGAYQSRHQYTYVAEILASYGYVVALMSHPFAGLDYFEGMGLVGRHARWTAPRGASYDESDAFYEPMTDVLAADARFVVDRLQSLTSEPGPFAGRLDLDRLGIIGHSRGGKTVVRAAVTDARFKAALVYDNLPPARERGTGLKRPVMLINVVDPQQPEHWRGAGSLVRWSPERLEAAHDFVRRNPAPAYEVTLRGAGHMNFSDRGLFEEARFPATLGGKVALDRIMAYSLAFLDHHVKRAPPPPLLRGEKIFAEAECCVGGTARTGIGP